MPNLNYAETWSPDLLEILMDGSYISPFITSKVKWLSNKTFHFTQMSTSGYKQHNRNGGWNTGNYMQEDVPFTLTHDRDISFQVDVADVDETNETASIKNVAKVFHETQATPEADAYFFSKVANKAESLDGYNSATAITAYTKDNVYSKLKSYISAGKLKRHRAKGALMCYVSGTIMDLLELSTELQRKIEMTQISESGLGIETRITDIDGVPIIEVVEDDRFYDKFDFTDGFAPVAHTDEVVGSRKINVLLASLLAVKYVPKINNIYYFAPGTHTEGDGYLYQDHSLSDTFIFPNGKDNKIDSVYVDVDTTEYTEPE
jgi:hypothetical protein